VGQAGWRAVFPIEKQEFSASWQTRVIEKGCWLGVENGGPAVCSAQQGRPEGCRKE